MLAGAVGCGRLRNTSDTHERIRALDEERGELLPVDLGRSRASPIAPLVNQARPYAVQREALQLEVTRKGAELLAQREASLLERRQLLQDNKTLK